MKKYFIKPETQMDDSKRKINFYSLQKMLEMYFRFS